MRRFSPLRSAAARLHRSKTCIFQRSLKCPLFSSPGAKQKISHYRVFQARSAHFSAKMPRRNARQAPRNAMQHSLASFRHCAGNRFHFSLVAVRRMPLAALVPKIWGRAFSLFLKLCIDIQDDISGRTLSQSPTTLSLSSGVPEDYAFAILRRPGGLLFLYPPASRRTTLSLSSGAPKYYSFAIFRRPGGLLFRSLPLRFSNPPTSRRTTFSPTPPRGLPRVFAVACAGIRSPRDPAAQ